jgi:polysaccharide export outer membrane protein
VRVRRSFVALLLMPGLVEWTSIATAGPLDFRIGTDDVLAISVWSEKDLDKVVSVRPDGKISLPLVGEIEAAGLTVAELASRLTTLYRRTVPGAQVTVAVREIHRRQVFFLGGVVRPGPIQLTEELTILQALSVVGGPIPIADLESAFVLRGATRIRVNIQRMLDENDPTQNLRLQSGDTVVVPTRVVCPSVDCVWVLGAVNAPGPLKYARGLTLMTAIEAAGGFTPYASRRVTISRGHRQEDELLVSIAPRSRKEVLLAITPRREKEIFLVITPNLLPGHVPTVRSDAPQGDVMRFKVAVDGRVDDDDNVPLKPNDLIIVPQRQRLF